MNRHRIFYITETSIPSFSANIINSLKFCEALSDFRRIIFLLLKNEINSKNPEGRVIIRPSGTEPLIRISIENKDQDVASTLAKDIINAIKENG